MRVDGERNPPPYVATFGFNRRLFLCLALWGVGALGFGGATVWFALTEPGDAVDPGFEFAALLAMSAAGAIFLGGTLSYWLTAALTTAVALRVDEKGVGLWRWLLTPTRSSRFVRVPGRTSRQS